MTVKYYKRVLIFLGIAMGAFITGTLLNKYTPLAYDPALGISMGVWVGGALLIWIIRKVKNRNLK